MLKNWTTVLNENYQYKQEATGIHKSIKRRAYFRHYAKILNNNGLL